MEDSALAEYSEFTIVDACGGDDPDAKPFAESWDERDITGDWLAAADNMLMINGSYTGAYHIRIRFELWNSDPGCQPDRHPDVDQLTTSFYSTSGSVMVEEMFWGGDHEPFALGLPRLKWHVRGYRKPLVPLGHFHHDIDGDAESYIFQFWPFG
ncbi:hypothetical protein ACWEN6_17940 [Sphaerisporangium sp. NPDC004334]